MKTYRNIKILEADYLKIKKWAAQRDLFDYEVISYLVNKK